MARGQIEFGNDSPAEREHINDALAAFGLYAEEELPPLRDECWLWPENEEAFDIWLALRTQWNAGMAGAIGLNYAGVESCLNMYGFKRKERQRMFPLIQMMEHATLEEWSHLRKR